MKYLYLFIAKLAIVSLSVGIANCADGVYMLGVYTMCIQSEDGTVLDECQFHINPLSMNLCTLITQKTLLITNGNDFEEQVVSPFRWTRGAVLAMFQKDPLLASQIEEHVSLKQGTPVVEIQESKDVLSFLVSIFKIYSAVNSPEYQKFSLARHINKTIKLAGLETTISMFEVTIEIISMMGLNQLKLTLEELKNSKQIFDLEVEDSD
jgi:hypothetical protein